MAHPAAHLIEQLGLAPHPEGGWYRELHRSEGRVRRNADGVERCGLTVIAFLLAEGETSHWHRVHGTDEIWQHGGGAPLDLFRLPPGGGTSESLTLAPLGDDGSPLHVIPAGWWQAARSRGPWSLAWCSVGPGFDFSDFQLMHDLAPADHPAGADPGLL